MSAPNGSVEQLEKLAQLKEKGVITQEEFDEKKKQILSADFGAQSTDTTKSKKRFPFVRAILLVVVVVIVGLYFISRPGPVDVDQLARAESVALQPEGELSDMFTIGSDYTDIQRENKIKEIKGKVITWRLPVYEVSRKDDGYDLATQASNKLGGVGSNLVGTMVKITVRNDEERKYMESLKTGDMVTFKGHIAYALATRTLRINPAILVMQGPAQQAPAQTREASQSNAPTGQAATPPEAIAKLSAQLDGTYLCNERSSPDYKSSELYVFFGDGVFTENIISIIDNGKPQVISLIFGTYSIIGDKLVLKVTGSQDKEIADSSIKLDTFVKEQRIVQYDAKGFTTRAFNNSPSEFSLSCVFKGPADVNLIKQRNSIPVTALQ